jgi:hypothetical protein
MIGAAPDIDHGRIPIQIASRLRLGRLLYLCWHTPRGFIGRCGREGALNLLFAAHGRRAMEAAASKIPPGEPARECSPEIYFLTGAKFWYQTAFCAYSLMCATRYPFRIVLVDDGTLTAHQARSLLRIFPGSHMQGPIHTERCLDTHLPTQRFPMLRHRRLVYPHLRKLTDVHVGSAGWKLVLDSDMLFFYEPLALLDWLHAPDRPCHMIDLEDAYGYSRALMTELAGVPIPKRVNVGVCGLRSDMIDWERVEHWCRSLTEREGTHYLLEQALVAMLIADQPCVSLPTDRYVVRPSRAETEAPTAALHHYVAEAKSWYFRFGWQSFQRLAEATTLGGH